MIAIDASPTIQRSMAVRWLGHPMTYAVGVPVLTLLGLATSLLIPRFVPPVEFGQYALLLNILRYAGRCDLGLTQLADRRLAARIGSLDPREASVLLEVRFLVAFGGFAILAPLSMIVVAATGWASPLDALFATLAGVLAMVADGPASLFRARSWVFQYTTLTFLCSLAFIVPRILGFAVAGVTGCFAALAGAYGVMVVVFAGPYRPQSWRTAMRMAPRLLAEGLPLFTFAAAWTVYLSISRWVCAALSSPEQLGIFTFAVNLALTSVTTLGAVAHMRYPRWLARIATAPSTCSRAFTRELILVGMAVAAAVIVAAPFLREAVATVFPAYRGSETILIAMGVACVPMASLAWSLPVAIAISRRPFRACLVTFGPASLTLVVGMVAANRIGGLEGQAWACTPSAILALLGFVFVMTRLRIIETRDALVFAAGETLLVALLVGLLTSSGISRAAAAESPIPAHYHVVFEDRFSTLRLWYGTSGVWEPLYPWGGHTNPTSHEIEYYLDPRFQRNGPNAFRTTREGLDISAMPRTRPLPSGLTYTSGLLNSAHAFTFTYGYVEMRARLPRGAGFWPAFWLLPADRSWPPEIDVMEAVGETDRYWATLHPGPDEATENLVQTAVAVAQPEGTFHDYAILWSAERIAWFLDGRKVMETTTPASCRQPMYLLVNLAVGGGWAGPPAPGASATMTIASIRVLQPEGAPR